MEHKTRPFGSPLKVMAFQITYPDLETGEETTTKTIAFRDSDGRITDSNGVDKGPIRINCEEQVEDWAYALADKGSYKIREIRPVPTVPMAVMHMGYDEPKEALKIVSSFSRGLHPEHKKILSRGFECYTNPGFYKQLGHDPERCIADAIALFKELYGR